MHECHIMEEVGIPAVVLMERAAAFAAKEIRNRIEKDDRILVVCGPGNNGADGIALARMLTEKRYVTDLLLLGKKEKYTQLRQMQEEIFRALSVGEIYQSVTDTKAFGEEYAVIVDAILGIGTSRELGGEIREAVDRMNELQGLKVALDIPTGICADTGCVLGTAFRADITTTFGIRKQGLFLGEGKVYAGEILYNGCGMWYPAEKVSREEIGQTFILDKKTIRKYLKRNPNGNKSTFGKLTFFAGSEKIAGAAILNVTAAFRCGAGYIRLCTHEKHKDAVLAAAPETVLELYGSETEQEVRSKISDAVDFADVICAGSGLGTDDRSKVMMSHLLGQLSQNNNRTWIFDADALNILAADNSWKENLQSSGSCVILTPHVLEFSRLSGLSVSEIKNDRIGVARKFARERGCILVLKDAQTVVAAPDGRVCVSEKGNDGMAVAGSGDVLAGIIAGIVGQMKDPYMSACVGVYLHGMAGDMAAEKLGSHSMLPTDMIHYLKKCMKKLGKEAL